MKEYLVNIIGLLAQALFSARMIVQWIKSEKIKEVVSPSLFWKISLLASFLLFVYGWLRLDFSIMLGQILTYFIYIRNLHFQNEWKKLHQFFRIFIIIFPFLVFIYSYNNGANDRDLLFRNQDMPFNLLVFGIVSQLVFVSRFVYQWVVSEKNKKSVLPIGFWLISTFGSLMVIVYAFIRKDYILLLGQFGLLIYLRNLYFSKKSKQKG